MATGGGQTSSCSAGKHGVCCPPPWSRRQCYAYETHAVCPPPPHTRIVIILARAAYALSWSAKVCAREADSGQGGERKEERERERERENEAHVAVLAWPVGLACAAWLHVPLRCRVCAAAREFLARGAVALGAVNLAGLVLARRLANLFVAEEPVALAAQATGLVKTRDTAQRNQGVCGPRAGNGIWRACGARADAPSAPSAATQPRRWAPERQQAAHGPVPIFFRADFLFGEAHAAVGALEPAAAVRDFAPSTTAVAVEDILHICTR